MKEVTGGYKGFLGFKGVPRNLGVTTGYKGLHEETLDYKRLHGVTTGYGGLQKVTWDYKRLHGVTRGYKRLQGITRGYRGF